MPNPYTTRPVIAEKFFNRDLGGRGLQAHRILQDLRRINPPADCVSVVGDRRSGKTSLLGYLKQSLNGDPQLLTLSIDMLALPEQTSDGFYAMLKRQLVRAGELPPSDDPLSHLDLSDFLEDLQTARRGMILFVDEFDAVARDTRFDREFFDNLRSIASLHPLTLVVASVAPLSSVAHSGLYGSPFFNIFKQERLGPLSPSAAMALITDAAASGAALDRIADELIKLAGYHPFFLQRACACAWDHIIESDDFDVPLLRSTFASNVGDHLQYLWNHSTNDERTALCGVAMGETVDSHNVQNLVERGYICSDGPMRVFSSVFEEFLCKQAVKRESGAFGQDGSVFVSYSHKDEKWLDELKAMLQPVLGNAQLTLCDDTHIKKGDLWDDEIQAAISRAKVAFLLVSDNFLASDYITQRELPLVLRAAKKREIVLVWALLSPCFVKRTDIAKYQAVHDTSKPLSSLAKHLRKAVMLSACEVIMQAAGIDATGPQG